MSTTKRVSGIAMVAVFTVHALSSGLYGKTVFYGPTPYLSQADSPFDLSGLGTSFWLEDFEDGELNTPGVTSEFSINQYALSVDSVDADDGAIDGDGVNGASAIPHLTACTNGVPIRCVSYATFVFSPSILGQLPTAVGLVWTDGDPSEHFDIKARDAAGSIIIQWNTTGLGGVQSFDAEGETTEDRFIGVRHDAGIAKVEILQSGELAFMEFDHLQYGYQVPEPSSAALLLAGGLGVAALRFRKQR